MSQTETLLLVVLGFALAALIALFIGRLMWSAAIRIGARRMQKQVPTSLVGLQTERDRLRAEYAMLAQRLGSRLEAVKQRLAEQMAEVNRHRNRIELMERNFRAREAAFKESEALVASLRAELAAAVAARDAILLPELPAVDMTLPEPAEPSSPASAPEGHAAAAPPVPESIQRLTHMADEVAREREPAALTPDSPDLESRLAEAERGAEDLQKELEKLDEEWSKRLQAAPGGDSGAGEQPTAVANVISLANRIRDLKKGMGPNA